MVRNPFAHKDSPDPGAGDRGAEQGADHGTADAGRHRHGIPLVAWLRREEAGFSRGRSSLFFTGHDAPLPPERTCLQGHEIPPGETTCSHGHPAG